MNNDKSESDQCKAENSEMGKIKLNYRLILWKKFNVRDKRLATSKTGKSGKAWSYNLRKRKASPSI